MFRWEKAERGLSGRIFVLTGRVFVRYLFIILYFYLECSMSSKVRLNIFLNERAEVP